MKPEQFIVPDWPAPSNVNALCTTRQGGVSTAPYDSFNVAAHVADDAANVEQNRARLREQALLPGEPYWLQQVHTDVAVRCGQADNRADASWSDASGDVCAVLTADCLPLLLCNRSGTRVAAAHAGWRGLHAGIIQRTVECFDAGDDLLAWMGPAIGPDAFEVGVDVYRAFIEQDAGNAQAFRQTDAEHWLCDIYRLAKSVLQSKQVTSIYGGEYCSLSDNTRFYSYRRDGDTGRMASLIWLS